MHIPVLLKEIISYLEPKDGKVILDCTVNGAGHAQAILNLVIPSGLLIGIDQDRQALRAAQERLAGFKDKAILIKENFRNIDRVLWDLGVTGVDGMLFDLGMSSLQLDDEKRGFSIRLDAPLDMRMDLNAEVSAWDIVNKGTEDELERILRDYGQERWCKRIARAIVKKRHPKPIERTKDLAGLIESVVRRRKGVRIHPATRTFQALRIAVNDELSALDEALNKAVNFLNKKGRICVLSYHSLEDRITKQKFKSLSLKGKVRLLTKKPVVPSAEEIQRNPRSRSAKLRAAEKL
ncbi:MAG: 16S rRNA (cytosine(1402)-N(4))-methyltransferase RsmH [Candidatus Omnitrophota bacterium]